MTYMEKIQKNSIHIGRIDGWSSDAAGVCHLDGRAVFVPGALPGEEWELRIVKVASNAVYARRERLLLPSDARIQPDCPYYGKCGGCDTRHMSYEEELRFKRQRVDDALERIGRQQIRCSRILGAARTDRYRNKAIFAVSQSAEGPRAGFYRERSHDLIPVEDRLLQSELSCRCAAAVVDFLRAKDIPAFDEQSGRGTVRHVFCRQAWKTKDAVLTVVSARGFGSETRAFVEHLRDRCPELTGIVLLVNKAPGNAILSGDLYPLWGDVLLHDELCGLRFSIAPQAFFQIDPPQAERLYEQAAAYAAAGPEDLLFDLYCGAGTISLRMAREAGRVIGAEIVPEAVDNARENAIANGVANAEFLCGDAGEAAAALAVRGLAPKIVVVDPPRKGMSEDAVRAVASMSPERIVYVSCDSATLARDILRFEGLGYALREVTAVDMFPRTAHIESVVLMSRGG